MGVFLQIRIHSFTPLLHYSITPRLRSVLRNQWLYHFVDNLTVMDEQRARHDFIFKINGELALLHHVEQEGGDILREELRGMDR